MTPAAAPGQRRRRVQKRCMRARISFKATGLPPKLQLERKSFLYANRYCESWIKNSCFAQFKISYWLFVNIARAMTLPWNCDSCLLKKFVILSTVFGPILFKFNNFLLKRAISFIRMWPIFASDKCWKLNFENLNSTCAHFCDFC